MFNSGINKVFLVGYIAKEPRCHKSPNRPDMLSFTLLTKENIVKNGSVVEHCEYHQIRIQADKLDKTIVLSMGKLVYLKGKIKTSSSTDEQNVKRYKTEIVAEQIQVLLNIEMAVLNEAANF